MDENRPPYRLHAPGVTPSTTYELPRPGSPRTSASRHRRRPRLDEHRVRPEDEERRAELIDGQIVRAQPADFPHAAQNGDLDYLLRAHLAPEYRVATDLLTRFDRDNDFASDSAVVRTGIDPRTGTRHLEELAFEIVSEQSAAVAAKKAARMLRRGVERVFAIFVKKRQVAEWVSEREKAGEGRWRPLDPDSAITHPSLAAPLPVAAILDAALQDAAVVQALDARGEPTLMRIRTDERSRGELAGELKGKAEAILAVLTQRSLAPSAAVRRRVLGCTDLDVLDRWLRAAVDAAVAEDVVKD